MARFGYNQIRVTAGGDLARKEEGKKNAGFQGVPVRVWSVANCDHQQRQ